MPKRRQGEILHTSLSGQRSVYLGRKPKGLRTAHSFRAFVDQARRTKEGQAHLAQHHRGYNPKGLVSEALAEANEEAK